jgi:hypothetical protein
MFSCTYLIMMFDLGQTDEQTRYNACREYLQYLQIMLEMLLFPHQSVVFIP